MKRDTVEEADPPSMAMRFGSFRRVRRGRSPVTAAFVRAPAITFTYRNHNDINGQAISTAMAHPVCAVARAPTRRCAWEVVVQSAFASALTWAHVGR